ncbi:MAG: D-2-hydroxyacid dehydrogenase [Planctomycetes bacterium]|nr:D-2-hydroxyacid dehydrogenase [Planctomycetota bacterium]
MKIVVLDGYALNPGDNPWAPVAELGDLTVHDRTPAAQILERARGAEIILTNKTPLSAEMLAKLDRLRFISVLATGYNIVDVPAAAERGIVVSNVPVYGTDSVAQFVFALLLHFCHNVAGHDAAVKAGEWSRAGDFCFWITPLTELKDKTIGIIGFGRIGRTVGTLASAFGMRVLAADDFREDPPAYAFQWADADTVFREADVVTLHCPLTDDNPKMVNAETLGKMKPGAILINTARGGLVDEAALAQALNEGRIRGAACDVVSAEPIPPDSPLLRAKNILLTPHIAWATLEARRRLMRTTADNVAAFIAGHPINVVR